MCGRLTLDATPEELVDHFGIDPPPPRSPRFNIAPSQLVAAVGQKPDGVHRGLILVRWGLVPDWANDARPGPINARAETVTTKPTFRDSFLYRRCLIPATGFYEWTAEGGRKLPHFIRRKGGGLLGLAALWSLWKGDGKPLSDLLRRHHGRELPRAAAARPDAGHPPPRRPRGVARPRHAGRRAARTAPGVFALALAGVRTELFDAMFPPGPPRGGAEEE
jgi:hypothetical protein